ncbi:MAG: hypothetical protein AAB617_02160 [Patescibacteria group bacterium]
MDSTIILIWALICMGWFFCLISGEMRKIGTETARIPNYQALHIYSLKTSLRLWDSATISFSAAYVILFGKMLSFLFLILFGATANPGILGQLMVIPFAALTFFAARSTANYLVREISGHRFSILRGFLQEA